MNKIRAIIVDDEYAARNVLKELISLTHSDVEVIDSVSNVPDAVLSIKENKPDLVFLDVDMPKYSGYELVKFIDEVNFHIIFVTAHDKFALKAFEVNAVDYILKPINRKRLSDALVKVKSKIKEQADLDNYALIMRKLSVENASTLVLSETGQKRVLKTTDIIAVQAQGAYSEIHIVNGEKITVSKNIGTIGNELVKDKDLYRCHKSWIVNLKHINHYKKSELVIALNNGLVCKLSRFKKQEFDKLMLEQ